MGQKLSACIETRYSKNGHGYGLCRFRGRTMMAHRAEWIKARGPIPDGMLVLHRCDNRACVNVDHLFLGTHHDNSMDMVAKGRHIYGEKHPLSKLTPDLVRQIRAETTISDREIGEKFGISKSHAQRVRTGERWGRS